MTDDRETATPLFLYNLRNVTEAAACAAFDWIGRGRPKKGEGAALAAMLDAIDRIKIDGTIVIGDVEQGCEPEIKPGQKVGAGAGRHPFDIAIDPVEGINYLAKGLTNAMSVTALAPRGTMFDQRAALYMEKFAAPPAAQGKIDPAWAVDKKLKTLAKLLGKDIRELEIFVLEKPRHKELVARIHETGARIALYPAGDIVGAVMAAVPDSGIDALMGTGGVPEGILSACAARALGGEFMGRLDPQLPSEQIAVKNAGVDTKHWYFRDELVSSQDIFFCATGITTGLFLEGVTRKDGRNRVQTFMAAGATGERQILTSWKPINRKSD